MPLTTVYSGVSLASMDDEGSMIQKPQADWTKQISMASTACPGTPDSVEGFSRGVTQSSGGFSRGVTQSSEPEHSLFDVDFYEARGGMATRCIEEHSSEVPEVVEPDCGSAVDFYEARGGLAAWAEQQQQQPDFYEARGGMAARCASPPSVKSIVARHVAEVELADGQDLYEVRGGLAGWLAERASQQRTRVDFYEARGGMANMCETPPVAAKSGLVEEMELDDSTDLYETRGGYANWLASRALSKKRARVDFYEARGGMVSMCAEIPAEKAVGSNAVELPDGSDLYEVRGGYATWLADRALAASQKKPKLDEKPEISALPANTQELPDGSDLYEVKSRILWDWMAAKAAEVDFYEARGGMAAACPMPDTTAASRAAASRLTSELELTDGTDLYEVRGGCAKWLAEKADEARMDFYETRGGMAAKCSEPTELKNSRNLAAEQQLSDGSDLYEVRGGCAQWKASQVAAEKRRSEIDFYEARGGMAATCSEPVDTKAIAMAARLEQELADGTDLYEVRGGCAQWIAEQASASRSSTDFYEARGGMAAKALEPAEVKQAISAAKLLVAELELCDGTDLYEVRGGCAQWLADSEKSDAIDFYEARGGMAARCPQPLATTMAAPMANASSDGPDPFEARGGYASWLESQALGNAC